MLKIPTNITQELNINVRKFIVSCNGVQNLTPICQILHKRNLTVIIQ